MVCETCAGDCHLKSISLCGITQGIVDVCSSYYSYSADTSTKQVTVQHLKTFS
jgi:hypothetical protein